MSSFNVYLRTHPIGAFVTCILGIVALIALSLLIPRWYVNTHLEPSRRVPGASDRFDVIAQLTEVRAYVGESAKLVSIDIHFVKSDGTMDLTAPYRPFAAYHFMAPTVASVTAPPIGTTSTDLRWQEPVTITVSRPGTRHRVKRQTGTVSLSYTYTNAGMKRVKDPAIFTVAPDDLVPRCSLAALWRAAMMAGAPSDAVATIHIDQSGYRFSIPAQNFVRDFRPTCELRSS